MKIIKTSITLSLLLGTFSFNSNLYAEVAAEKADVSITAESEHKVNEYIYGADSDAYTATKLQDVLFVMNDHIPKGWQVGVLGYKFKDSNKAQEWLRNFLGFIGNTIITSVRKQKKFPADQLTAFEKDSVDLFDNTQIKFFTPAEAVSGVMTKEGYGCTFANFYALVSEDNKSISADWLYDPNVPLLQKAGINTSTSVLFRWKNPEYKAPETTTCAPGATVPGKSPAAVVDASTGVTSLKTTETFVFKGDDFEQSFQVVASDEEVVSNPEGIKEITNRLVHLFNDMPKVGSTIIGRMITTDGILGVCPVICEIDGKKFKANLMFDANTTADQAQKLANELDEKFSILKKQLLEKHKDAIDAEHQRVSEEHNLRLAALKQIVELQEKMAKDIEEGNAVNISDANSADDVIQKDTVHTADDMIQKDTVHSADDVIQKDTVHTEVDRQTILNEAAENQAIRNKVGELQRDVRNISGNLKADSNYTRIIPADKNADLLLSQSDGYSPADLGQEASNEFAQTAGSS